MTQGQSGEATKHCPSEEIEPGLRALLDHLAVELAQEYVRLMENAAAQVGETEAKPIEQGGLP